MSQARLAVIVPARDAEPTLDRALSAVAAQRLDESFEVIVVDDGSSDRTAEIARQYAPLVQVFRNPESEGPGAARNRAVRATRARFLAFTDADCFPTPTWLEAGLRAIAHADLVQGRVDPDPAVTRTPFDRTLWVEDHGGFYQTANLFVRRETFEAAGGFRDWALERKGRRRWPQDRRRARATRTPIGEDTLFAWTARRSGARSAFCPDAVVHHAVVRGGVSDDIADRWHWTRDMPGLARLVPELRHTTFYRRWFFSRSTAHFDMALAGLVTAAAMRRRAPLLATCPYVHRLLRESLAYDSAGALRAITGMPIVEATTLLGLLVGSIEWRSLVL